MDFLDGVGDFMTREGLTELEILDGFCVIKLHRSPSKNLGLETSGTDIDFITSPLSGILHLSSSDGEPPYAAAGDYRKQGDILFCVEVMKHINEVHAEFDLVVEEILVEEFTAIRQGQAILRISKGGN